MKRLLLLTILIGLLFTSPNSFAQSSKPKRATIKYGNGVKYVGEIRASLQKLPETADMANNKYMLSNSERAILRHVESASDKVISPLQSMDDNLHPLVNYMGDASLCLRQRQHLFRTFHPGRYRRSDTQRIHRPRPGQIARHLLIYMAGREKQITEHAGTHGCP